jgi:hypothetical protein
MAERQRRAKREARCHQREPDKRVRPTRFGEILLFLHIVWYEPGCKHSTNIAVEIFKRNAWCA